LEKLVMRYRRQPIIKSWYGLGLFILFVLVRSIWVWIEHRGKL
jgi:hypothetical protein